MPNPSGEILRVKPCEVGVSAKEVRGRLQMLLGRLKPSRGGFLILRLLPQVIGGVRLQAGFLLNPEQATPLLSRLDLLDPLVRQIVRDIQVGGGQYLAMRYQGLPTTTQISKIDV